MNFEDGAKLDYSQVLIRPKRSVLRSRSEVTLQREFNFRWYEPQFESSGPHYRGVPIMAANMDGVGTFEMATAIAQESCFTVLRKHYSSSELVEWFDGPDWKRSHHSAMCIGIKPEDHAKFAAKKKEYEDYTGVKWDEALSKKSKEELLEKLKKK